MSPTIFKFMVFVFEYQANNFYTFITRFCKPKKI
jgi:hypothetical protein